MNIQIFGSSKCFDTKKAERFSPGEYRSVRAKLSFEQLVNTKCRAYQDLYMAYITPDAAEEKLFDHPQLFLTPIVRNGREVTVGYCPEIWAKWE